MLYLFQFQVILPHAKSIGVYGMHKILVFLVLVLGLAAFGMATSDATHAEECCTTTDK